MKNLKAKAMNAEVKINSAKLMATFIVKCVYKDFMKKSETRSFLQCFGVASAEDLDHRCGAFDLMQIVRCEFN